MPFNGKNQRATTLIELVLVISVMSGIYLGLQQTLLGFYRKGWRIAQYFELQQIAFNIGRKITKEIRRANFMAIQTVPISLNNSYFANDCLVIAYDFNRDGVISNRLAQIPERIAYRWQRQRLEYGVVNVRCYSEYWQSLIDYSKILVTLFRLHQYSEQLVKFELQIVLKKAPNIRVQYNEWISLLNGQWSMVMSLIYPILLGFAWLTLQLAGLWGELQQQRLYWLREVYYLKQYYWAQSALIVAINYLWDDIYLRWQCQQYLEMQFCVKLLDSNLALIRGNSIELIVEGVISSEPLILYQLASFRYVAQDNRIQLRFNQHGWLDFCPLFQESLCY